jgi:hypothetical protein
MTWQRSLYWAAVLWTVALLMVVTAHDVCC